jgi:hypothetical protein
MRIASINKILADTNDFGKYEVKSYDCALCQSEGVSVLIAPEKLYAYNQGALADVVLDVYDLDVRERFVSGTCESCWDSMFKEG